MNTETYSVILAINEGGEILPLISRVEAKNPENAADVSLQRIGKNSHLFSIICVLKGNACSVLDSNYERKD